LKGKTVTQRATRGRLWLAFLLVFVASLARNIPAQTDPSPTPGASEYIKELAAKLMAGDLDLTLLAALDLLKIENSDEALAALRDALECEEEEVRIKVMKAFELQRDPRANDVLVTALSDQNDRIRGAAVSALSEQRIETLLAPLSQVLLTEDAAELSKQGVARVLKTKRNKQAIFLLIQALKENPENVKAECAAALIALTSFDFGEGYQGWLDWWNSVEKLSREELLEMILQHREEQLAEVKETLKAVEAEVAGLSIKLLEGRSDRTSPALLAEATRAKHPAVRKYAAAELGKIESEEAARILVEAINDESADVRTEIIDSLGKIGEKARLAVAAIGEALLNDPQPVVREAAAAALMAIKDKDSTSSLIDALCQDLSWEVRAKAAKALGNIGATEAVSTLLKALYADPEPAVRREAAWALGQTGDRSTIPMLSDRLVDEDHHLVRRAIAQSLGQLGGKEAASVLMELAGDSDPRVREAAFAALGKTGDPAAVGPLTKGLLDADEKGASAAADALEKVLPDNLNAYLELAEQQTEQGNNSLAARLFEITLRHFADKASEQEKLWDVKRRLAAFFLDEKNYKKALPLYDDLAQHDLTPEALQALALCYEVTGNYLDAAKTHLSMTQIEGSNVASEWEKIAQNAVQLKSSGSTEELRELLNLLYEKAPDLGTPETKATLEALKEELAPSEPSPTPTPSPVSPSPPATSPTSSAHP